MKIKISGYTGEGKSTVAKFLKEVLDDAGFDVSLEDESLSIDWHLANNDRMKSLADKKLNVDIETVNLRRAISTKGLQRQPIVLK